MDTRYPCWAGLGIPKETVVAGVRKVRGGKAVLKQQGT